MRPALVALLIVSVIVLAGLLVRLFVMHPPALLMPRPIASAPAGGTPLPRPFLQSVLVGAGDIAECQTNGDEMTAALLDQVVEEYVAAAVFTTGDSAYPDGSYQEYVDCYDPTWGRHKDRTHPAVGNHDFKQTQAEGYHQYWGDRGGPFDLYYYSYDIGSWHVVVLNSECHRVGCEFGSEDGSQVEWLQTDLRASDADCTIAIWHNPRWSSGRYGSDPMYDTFWQVLYEHGAEIVLNGHEHLYERFEPMDPDGDPDATGRHPAVYGGNRRWQPARVRGHSAKQRSACIRMGSAQINPRRGPL